MERPNVATARAFVGGVRSVTPAIIMDGRAAAARLRAQLVPRIATLRQLHDITPALAVIRVGSDPASAIYVSNKIKACAAAGVKSVSVEVPDSIATSELVDLVERFNADPGVHGILVQLPLPRHIDLRRVLESISIEKDVDGFHLYNVGGLVVGDMVFPPCTPYGVLKLLESEGVTVAGENVVVVGASNIVGKPMGLMLLQQGATVSICHANTRDLAQHTIIADILIVAAGRPRLIVPSMVKTGAVVVDVGINRLPDGSITGDVEFDGVSGKASRITPVPGGVGPMTVSMLLENTVVAAERSAAATTT
jgi:methylenetetrahydrofolate dehydrogenase (NADP+)/methenyltetrahydrofolate cyclohydrolase